MSERIIEDIWQNISDQEFSITKEQKEVVINTIENLENGTLRTAEKKNGKWEVNGFVKKAILIYMKIHPSSPMNIGGKYFDKIPLKFENFTKDDFEKGGYRVVPGVIVRKGAFIGKRVILMPCFVNMGAYIDSGTMVDTWATVGSCAQIGKNCHISGGAGIGGVLEPANAMPVIIEDNVFIGARSEIAEGVIVEDGSVISMGVYIGASTKIINRETGEIIYGRVPKGSVVVPGTIAGKNGVNLYAAIIVKQVDEQTRSKTSITELLRD
jgi:2,3,4,5-tetrahydropyridine-2-carboxylate N-succinyltransferase